MKLIAFHKPSFSEPAVQYAMESLKSGNTRGSLNASFGSRAVRILENLVPRTSVFLTPSCTSALEITSLLMCLRAGDEVIMPAYNFTSAAIAVSNYGAVPVFVDIDIENLCIDTNLIQNAITQRTRAISWVNYGGAVPNVIKLKEIAVSNGIFLVEDAAHGIGYDCINGGLLGSNGDFSVTSFHETKNIQCGEGGALILNNLSYLDQARIIVEKGTNRWQFSEGKTTNYEWVGPGGSHLMADSLAAVLLGQLYSHAESQKRRQEIYIEYYIGLREWAQDNKVLLPQYGSSSSLAAHLFYLICPSAKFRINLQDHLKNLGITSLTHYRNLASTPAGSIYGRTNSSLDVTNTVVNRLLRIPLWEMNEEESNYVIRAIINFRP